MKCARTAKIATELWYLNVRAKSHLYGLQHSMYQFFHLYTCSTHILCIVPYHLLANLQLPSLASYTLTALLQHKYTLVYFHSVSSTFAGDYHRNCNIYQPTSDTKCTPMAKLKFLIGKGTLLSIIIGPLAVFGTCIIHYKYAGKMISASTFGIAPDNSSTRAITIKVWRSS